MAYHSASQQRQPMEGRPLRVLSPNHRQLPGSLRERRRGRTWANDAMRVTSSGTGCCCWQGRRQQQQRQQQQPQQALPLTAVVAEVRRKQTCSWRELRTRQLAVDRVQQQKAFSVTVASSVAICLHLPPLVCPTALVSWTRRLTSWFELATDTFTLSLSLPTLPFANSIALITVVIIKTYYRLIVPH